MRKKELTNLVESAIIETMLDETGARGYAYEEAVISVINSLGMTGNITSGAGASAAAADADIKIDDDIYNIEVKLDGKAQMGGTSLRYFPEGVTVDVDGNPEQKKFVIVSDAVDPDSVALMEEALTPLEPALKEFMQAIGASKMPATVLKDSWEQAKVAGLLKPLNVKIKRTTSFIINHYKKKGIDYIQIGGAGLFYLANNPANLPIPQLDGEINIELRPGRSGSKTRKDGTKVVGGLIRVQGRLQFKGQSPYTLDDPESIKAMLEARQSKSLKEQVARHFDKSVYEIISEMAGKLSEDVDLGDVDERDPEEVCLAADGCADFDEEIQEALVEQEVFSGQQSERNLVQAVKAVVAKTGGPVSLSIGNLGQFDIVDAGQLGGGNPEPKADIKLVTASGDEIGLSMKKENFGFFESWMDERKFRFMLKDAGLEDNESDVLVSAVMEKLLEVTSMQSDIIKDERQRFISVAQSVDPSYQFPNKIGEDILQALLGDEMFSLNGKFKNRFKVANVYLKLSDVLGEKYKSFLSLVVGGASSNKNKAQAVLVADVPPGIEDAETLSSILSKTQSVDTVVKKYMDDPNINIKFRLRPITLVRTTYSGSNRTKYKKGQGLYEDANLGVSWTVHTVR